MANLRENKIYEFEHFRLDAAHLLLYRQNEEISLTPKAVETLLALVERRGEVVGKDELMEKIWSGAAVEESNLSQYLHILRKTLGTRSDGKPFIETLRRRGYRFNGKVRVSEGANGFSTLERRDADAEEIKNHFPLNDSGESRIKNPTSRSLRVERRGNVLALADWTESEKDSGASELAAPQISIPKSEISNPELSNSKSRLTPFVIVAALAVVILLAAVLFVRYKPAPNFAASGSSESKKELAFLRLTNGVNPHYATISPDGKYFAYSERDGETWSFFVQQTGQSNRLEIIPPSERKIFDKTFSPDYSFIYFLAQDKGETRFSLYRIPTLGGVQTKILDDIRSSVSFSSDGKEMVFARLNQQTGESALVIAASDGSAERILQSRAGGQEILTYPAWSPDGATIAFSELHPGFMKINGINLQTGEISSLSPEKWDNCYRIAWMPGGEGLVFVGTKFGEGLSTRRDNVYYLSIQTGEARCLTVDGNRYQLYSLGVTDDDQVIAVPDSRLSQIWQMSPDGDSRSAVQITHGLQDGRVGVAPLADGRVGYIARTGEYLNLWLMNADGTEQKQLTNDPSYIQELRASPDGSYFVFLTERDRLLQLFRIGADGASLRQLTFDGNGVGDSTISPDGNWIVYHSSIFDGGKYKHALWKIPSAGGAEPIRVSDADCYVPHFSPDGKFLSCARREKEILILSAETGEILKTFPAVQPAVLNNGAHWTRDGQNLVYKVEQKKVTNLWIQPVSNGGGAARQLTDFTAHGIWNFAFSADGSRLYVVRVYQANDAVLIKNFK